MFFGMLIELWFEICVTRWHLIPFGAKPAKHVSVFRFHYAALSRVALKKSSEQLRLAEIGLEPLFGRQDNHHNF